MHQHKMKTFVKGAGKGPYGHPPFPPINRSRINRSRALAHGLVVHRRDTSDTSAVAD